LGSLTESYQQMVTALGGNAQSTSLGSFLTTFSQNLADSPSTGNLVDVTA
jgi:hypothetical protein